MNPKKSPYDTNLGKNPANFVPLSPLSFIEKTKDVYPNYSSVIYGDRIYTWLETYNRCLKFASALEKHGIGLGDTVSIIATNTPEIFETHYSVPMTGAVLNTINTRLEADTIAYILEHGDAKAFIVDTQFSPAVKEALAKLKKEILVIDIEDPQANLQEGQGERLGKYTYEEFLEKGDAGKPVRCQGGCQGIEPLAQLQGPVHRQPAKRYDAIPFGLTGDQSRRDQDHGQGVGKTGQAAADGPEAGER